MGGGGKFDLHNTVVHRPTRNSPYSDPMKKIQINNRNYLKKYRKDLRNDGTKAEAVLWTHLQKRQLGGYKFRRQHSILNYIIDFYCPEKRVAVELDGAYHFTVEGQLKDAHRDEVLGQLNIKVLRFENKWIFQDLEGVLRVILNTLQQLP